jgi:hypothetical protein
MPDNEMVMTIAEFSSRLAGHGDRDVSARVSSPSPVMYAATRTSSSCKNDYPQLPCSWCGHSRPLRTSSSTLRLTLVND